MVFKLRVVIKEDVRSPEGGKKNRVMLAVLQRRFPCVSCSGDATHNSSERRGNLFPLVLICYSRLLVCPSAVWALQRGGRLCSRGRRRRCTPYSPIPVVPFMVQGPLISTGSCTYFMDTSLFEGGRRAGGVVSRRRRLMMDCTSSSCASQASHFTAERFWIIWCGRRLLGGRRGVMSPDRAPRDWTEEHSVDDTAALNGEITTYDQREKLYGWMLNCSEEQDESKCT